MEKILHKKPPWKNVDARERKWFSAQAVNKCCTVRKFHVNFPRKNLQLTEYNECQFSESWRRDYFSRSREKNETVYDFTQNSFFRVSPAIPVDSDDDNDDYFE